MTGLELVEVEAYDVRATVTTELTHLCPFKDEVDRGSVTLSWEVHGHTLELHGLRAWLDSLRDVKVSHEDLTADLHDHLVNRGLIGVRVTTRWETAGMAVEVTA